MQPYRIVQLFPTVPFAARNLNKERQRVYKKAGTYYPWKYVSANFFNELPDAQPILTSNILSFETEPPFIYFFLNTFGSI